MDFTLSAYKKLISTLQSQGYFFQTFKEYIQNPKEKVVILRYDVDRLPGNSLKTALLENELGIRATYFFRTIAQTFKAQIIKEIAEMGHEVGYHYENLSEISKEKRVKSEEKLFKFAIDDFRLSLEKLRKLYPVKTICMHGSPLSKWDNRDLWKKYDYRDYGIIAEPYFDVNFGEVFYLTDTGRRWDGDSVSVRDKVNEDFGIRPSEIRSAKLNSLRSDFVYFTRQAVTSSISRGKEVEGLRFRTTWDIIAAAERGLLPDRIMLNIHPQKWDDRFGPWVKELVWQNLKNVVKRYIYVRR